VRRFLPLLLLCLLAGAIALGRSARGQMDIDYSPESIQHFVDGLGLKAPLIFVTLVTFRQFLALPSMVVLTAGGLAFGAALGGLLGALGILLSACFGFCVARWMGREWVQRYVGAKFADFEQRMDRAGLAVVGLMTAHPMGVMTPVHWGAGLTRIRLLPFVAVIAATATIRAFAYAFFGATLLESGDRVYVAMAVLAAIALLPLAHPGLRRRILATRPWRRDRSGDQ